MNKDRLMRLLMWNIMTFRKDIMRRGIIFAIFTAAAPILGTGMLWLREPINEYAISGYANFIRLALVFALVAAFGRVAFNLRTKESRISYLMLPATKLEKYVVNIITQAVVCMIVVMIGIMAGDIVQALLSQLLCGNWYSIVAHLLPRNGFDIVSIMGRAINDSVILAIWLYSCFLLGGTYFRKNPVFCTFCVLFALSLVFTVCVAVAGAGVMAWLVNNDYTLVLEPSADGATVFEIVASIVFFALTVVNVLLSFRYFKRIQVIR